MRAFAVSLSTVVITTTTVQAAHPEGVQEPWDGGVCRGGSWRGKGARQREYLGRQLFPSSKFFKSVCVVFPLHTVRFDAVSCPVVLLVFIKN